MPINNIELSNVRQYCVTLALRFAIEQGAYLVDVREPTETAVLAFDVPNVITLPMSEFEQRFRELPRDQELILVSLNGERSLKTTYSLMQHGYDKVANLEKGLYKWLQRGFPIRRVAD